MDLIYSIWLVLLQKLKVSRTLQDYILRVDAVIILIFKEIENFELEIIFEMPLFTLNKIIIFALFLLIPILIKCYKHISYSNSNVL